MEEQPVDQPAEQPKQVTEPEVANICCLCEFNHTITAGFTHCVNREQKDKSLKTRTLYNDGCKLFEEASHRKGIYDPPASAPAMNPQYSCECGWAGDELRWVKNPAKKYQEGGGGFNGCPDCKSKQVTKNW